MPSNLISDVLTVVSMELLHHDADKNVTDLLLLLLPPYPFCYAHTHTHTWQVTREIVTIERFHRAFERGLCTYGMIKGVKAAAPAPEPAAAATEATIGTAQPFFPTYSPSTVSF